jgi:hypothetical protein
VTINSIWPTDEAVCPACNDTVPLVAMDDDTGMCGVCTRYGPEHEQEEAVHFLARYGHRRTNERPH